MGDERIAEIRREKEAAIDAEDWERVAQLRDQEKQRLVEIWEEAVGDDTPTGRSVSHTNQPLPIINDAESIQSMVRQDLITREQVGISRYGTSLQAHNGRDALRDAYEEALDLACYLRQAIEERNQT